MQQHNTRGRPEASGPPPSVGAVILRWLHDQDRTLAFLASTAAINADNTICWPFAPTVGLQEDASGWCWSTPSTALASPLRRQQRPRRRATATYRCE